MTTESWWGIIWDIDVPEQTIGGTQSTYITHGYKQNGTISDHTVSYDEMDILCKSDSPQFINEQEFF